MVELIVRNKRVVSEYFNIPLEDKEDLFNRTEKNIKKFIKTYQNVLVNDNYDKLKEFTKQTGLSILRVYHYKDSYNVLYLDERGMVSKWENDYHLLNDKDYVFKHHLTVHIYLDKVTIENNCVYGFVNDKKQLIYKEAKEYNKVNDEEKSIRKHINQDYLLTEGQIKKGLKLLSKQGLPKLAIKEIKQIMCVYPFYDILILKKDGNLFVNGQLYAKKVRELCCLTSYRTYIIFDDDSVELYTCPFISSASPTIKAIKTSSINESFLASLTSDKDLFISTIGSDNCSSDFDCDSCIDFYLSNVDDFSYTYDIDNKVSTLNLIVGDKKILLPLYITIRK